MMGSKAIEITNQSKILGVTFKDDGHVVGADHSGALRHWSNDGVATSLSAMNVGALVYAVVASADGRWIVSGGARHTVVVWNGITHQKVREIAEHTDYILALDISSDSTRFASGSQDNTVRIFNFASGFRLLPPLQHSALLVDIKFSPDGSRLATAIRSSSQSVNVFDSRTGSKLFEISLSTSWPNTPLAWSSDGQQLFAASQGKITCLDTSTSSRSQWTIHNNSADKVSIVTSGKFIACSAGPSVSFWDSTSRDQIGSVIDHSTDVTCIAISRDGRYLACGLGSRIMVYRLEEYLPQHYLNGRSVSRLPLIQLSDMVLKSWMSGSPTSTEAILSDEIAQCSSTSHDAFATRALIRAHLGEWKAAIEDAELSLQAKHSPIGQIARSVALVGIGEKEAALDDLDMVFYECNPSDIKFLLVVKTIFLFVCDKRKQAISRLRDMISTADEKIKDYYLQVLGNMYMRQLDYDNAVKTLDLVKNRFTPEERGPLMTISIIFDWRFENLELTAWRRLCETLYTSGSIKEVGETLQKMVDPFPEEEKEPAHGRVLQEIITRSGEVTLLAWTGKSSRCNSCLPSSPTVYGQASVLLCRRLEGEQLEKRTAELRAIFPLTDALVVYGRVTGSPRARFAHFRLLLPCILFRVKSIRKGEGNVYRAETFGLGDVEFTTSDALPLKEPRRLVFVNPWIHHLDESRGGVTWEDEDEPGLDVDSNTVMWSGGAETDAELVHTSMIEEVSTPNTDAYTRALQLIARVGQPFNALLLLRQPDGAYKRVAADHEIAVRGTENNVPKDIRVEVLEVL